MPLPEATRRSYRLTWRKAGLWMVILALCLAILGMAFAIQQIRSFTRFLQARAQHRALRIANDVRTRFDQEIDAAFLAVAQWQRHDPNGSWQMPDDWPTWVDGVYSSDGLSVITLAAPAEAPAGLSALVEEHLTTRPHDHEAGNELVYDAIGTHPVVLACRWYPGPRDELAVVAARIHLGRLQTDLIEPLISPGDGLELAVPGRVSAAWGQPMFGVARFWTLQPTAAASREQRHAVIWQTLGYLSLTILALATLLIAMWYLMRLTRREMALAEMKANFVADVSHELKTPLATIRLFTETLQSGRLASAERRQEYYGIIIRETNRLTALINNILDFARIEAGRRPYTLAPTDVGKVLRETYEAYKPQLDHNGFEHSLTVADGLPLIDADRDGISQVLLNLMSNAVKYSGNDCYLAIEASPETQRDRQGVLISIHDHGIGIRPEDHAHLFEGFFRAADRRVRDRGGTGLGLALVKHIVDAHQGAMHVESRLVKGTTFRIFLPASENRPTGGEADSASEVSSFTGEESEE